VLLVLLFSMVFQLSEALLLTPAPAFAHCSGSQQDEGASGNNGAGNAPSGGRLETYSRNMAHYEHCRNEHWHKIWKWNGSHWVLFVNWTFCASWVFSDNIWNPRRPYECWKYWQVPSNLWLRSEGQSYTVTNHTASAIGKGHRYDTDWFWAGDCWMKRANGTWQRGCI
jgi:hypothetical protein